jgi:dephospho-CoA kinase
MHRDKVERKEVEARMQHQLPDEEKLKLADFVVYNDGGQTLTDQVLTIHQRLISGN